jgi:hypothetical protein
MSPTDPAPDVVRVHALGPYRLALELADGRRGTFDLAPYLDLPAYAALREPGYFARAFVACGTVCWPGEEDVSQETLAVRMVDDVDAPDVGQR